MTQTFFVRYVPEKLCEILAFSNTMINVQYFKKSEITFLFCDKIGFISVYLKHGSWFLFCLRCLSFAF